MPKRYTKTLGAFCDELGMSPPTASEFVKDTLKYLKSKYLSVPTIEDEEIAITAGDFLDSGAGATYFPSNAGHRFRWDTDEHRLRIRRYTNDIMRTQRWYAVDNLHQKLGGIENGAQCPGCIQHPQGGGGAASPPTTSGNTDGFVDLHYLSDVSDSQSLHHVIQQSTTEPTSPVELDSKKITTGIKRPRLTHDYHTLSGGKKQKTHHDAPVASPVSVPKPVAQGSSTTSTHETESATAPLAKSTPQPNHPTKVENIVDSQPATPAQTEASPHKVITLAYIKPKMRYRGKVWQFDSIAQKAKILEMILLQEEKDVESYPVLAFSKGAQRKSLDAADDADDDNGGEGGGNAAMKDYFRFYTHFMNERFPGNEKLLLQNGVKPSA
ncbi:hypothetical protein H2202_002764 [Exophiala xenobiotica]|nr:hypothetical protein H2202_002764 [Exophiala xenobiotica]